MCSHFHTLRWFAGQSVWSAYHVCLIIYSPLISTLKISLFLSLLSSDAELLGLLYCAFVLGAFFFFGVCVGGFLLDCCSSMTSCTGLWKEQLCAYLWLLMAVLVCGLLSAHNYHLCFLLSFFDEVGSNFIVFRKSAVVFSELVGLFLDTGSLADLACGCAHLVQGPALPHNHIVL